MPIDFKCSSCSHLIRVPDGTEGKKTMCPKCGTALRIPDGNEGESAPPPEDSNPESAGGSFSSPAPDFSDTGSSNYSSESANPYASPESAYQQSARTYGNNDVIQPQPADLGSIINYAFDCWKENLGILVGTFCLALLSFMVVLGPINIVQNILIEEAPEIGIVVVILGNIISNALTSFIGIGQIKIALKIARKEKAQVSDLFSGGPIFIPVFFANLLFGFGVMIGMFLCIVPGILLLLFFWSYLYLLVDEKASFTESFSIAYEIGSQNAGNTFLLGLLSLGIFILGYIALCIGIIFAAPLVTVIWAVAYLQMTGQLSRA